MLVKILTRSFIRVSNEDSMYKFKMILVKKKVFGSPLD